MGFDYRHSTEVGKQIFGGHKQIIMHTRVLEKGAVIPQETKPELPVSVHEFLAESWVDSGLLRGHGTEYNSAGISPFGEFTVIAMDWNG